uniref:Trans-2,3-enoyl-CoA reductase-like n=1 Tax=Ciona savignyi TaxID=51511 RepID=H2ZM98_CIOSA
TSIMEIQIVDAKSKNKICLLERVPTSASIEVVKELFNKKFPKYYPSRQSLRVEPRGKSLKDSDLLSKCSLGKDNTLYFKDLGTQLGWSTVFYCEYAGPLFIYLLFYFRLPFIYGEKHAFTSSNHQVVHIAAACHTFHYLKRVLETKFVHRFSHGTMPIRNLFKNCSYYWTFAAWPSYFINHPLYMPASFGDVQIYTGLVIFILCELGNYSIHVALRNLRPEGSKERKIPFPSSNPFTGMFNLVSCPNYTYEVGGWLAFAVMVQCLPSMLFATVGFIQMSVWALGKHCAYKREFSNYPRNRKAIVPFVL